MSCTGFLHLDAAPVNKPTYRQMETTLLEISTADGSHQPIVVELYDLLYLEPKQVTDAFTIASHGMTTSEFSDFIFETKPNQIAHRGIALYYYRSVEALGS